MPAWVLDRALCRLSIELPEREAKREGGVIGRCGDADIGAEQESVQFWPSLRCSTRQRAYQPSNLIRSSHSPVLTMFNPYTLIVIMITCILATKDKAWSSYTNWSDVNKLMSRWDTKNQLMAAVWSAHFPGLFCMDEPRSCSSILYEYMSTAKCLC